jgi:hypothetical protein
MYAFMTVIILTAGMIPASAFAALSSNADLSGLALSNGSLNPAFDAGTTSYSASVDFSVSIITVTPTVSDSNTAVTVNGAAVGSGSASEALELNEGSNTIYVDVQAQDGSTKTYTLTVRRVRHTTVTIDKPVTVVTPGESSSDNSDPSRLYMPFAPGSNGGVRIGEGTPTGEGLADVTSGSDNKPVTRTTRLLHKNKDANSF